MSIDSFIQNLLGANTAASPGFLTNELERDGNSNDPLFYIDQPSVGISGGTTLTNISPYTFSLNPAAALSELQSGKLGLTGLIWVALAVVAGWFLLKK